MPRFSEDLDFSLLEKNKEFSISPHLPFLIAEFEALGMEVSIREKPKNTISQIESAFLKTETEWKELILEQTTFVLPMTKPSLKIKLEVDTPFMRIAFELRIYLQEKCMPYSSESGKLE